MVEDFDNRVRAYYDRRMLERASENLIWMAALTRPATVREIVTSWWRIRFVLKYRQRPHVVIHPKLPVYSSIEWRRYGDRPSGTEPELPTSEPDQAPPPSPSHPGGTP